MATAYPRAVRRTLGIACGAVVAALGALVLGEYPFSGWLVVASGALLGLFVAEVLVGVGRFDGTLAVVVAAVLAGGGLVWGAWISEGHRLSELGAAGWLAVAVGMGVAGLGVRWSRSAPGIGSAPRGRD